MFKEANYNDQRISKSYFLVITTKIDFILILIYIDNKASLNCMRNCTLAYNVNFSFVFHLVKLKVFTPCHFSLFVWSCPIFS